MTSPASGARSGPRPGGGCASGACLWSTFTRRPARRRGGVPFSNEQPFSTGQGFAYRPFATMAAPAAAGAVEILIDEVSAEVAVGGYISHDDWPYIVVERAEVSGGVRLTLEMPLRRAIPDGAELDLYAHGLFRATSDDMGAVDTALGAGATVTVDVVEWLAR